MKRYKFKPGQSDLLMNRGAAESCSMFTKISAVAGNQITSQVVPHHRVMGMYMQSSTPQGYGDMFLGDDENEAVVLLQGIKFDYVRPQDWKDATPNYGGSVASGTTPSSTPMPTYDPVADKTNWLKNADLSKIQKYWTLTEIKDDAEILGLTPQDVAAYGKPSTKAAWIKALEAKKATL
jgi:hypothetical protein